MATNTGGTVTWYGAISDTTTALRMSGAIDGGGKVTFDIPDNQLVAALGLIAMRNMQLRITVEAVEWQEGGEDGRP